MTINRPWRSAAIGIVSVTMLAVSACSSGSGGGSDDETFTISLSSPYAETVPVAAPFKAFAEYLEEESDGRIEVETYWAGALAPPAEALQAAGSGLADVTTPTVAYYPQELPIANWAAPLASYADEEFFFSQMLTGSLATYDLMKDSLLLAEAEAANVVLLGTFVTDPNVVLCNKPVESIDDADGLQARSAGELFAAEFQAMSMSPVSLPFNEAYEGLQRGVIDCTMIPVGPAADFGLFEVASNVVDARMSGAVNWLTMNKDTFDSLPDDLQEIVREAGLVYTQEIMLGNIASAGSAVGDGGPAATAEFSRPADLAEALIDHQLAVIDGLKTNPPAGVSADDAERMVQEYQDNIARLTGLLADAGFATSDSDTLRDTILTSANDESSAAIREYVDSQREELLN